MRCRSARESYDFPHGQQRSPSLTGKCCIEQRDDEAKRVVRLVADLRREPRVANQLIVERALLRQAVAIAKPDQGTVHFLGQAVTALSPTRRARSLRASGTDRSSTGSIVP